MIANLRDQCTAGGEAFRMQERIRQKNYRARRKEKMKEDGNMQHRLGGEILIAIGFSTRIHFLHRYLAKYYSYMRSSHNSL